MTEIRSKTMLTPQLFSKILCFTRKMNLYSFLVAYFKHVSFLLHTSSCHLKNCFPVVQREHLKIVMQKW